MEQKERNMNLELLAKLLGIAIMHMENLVFM